jgi:hypothetical protein
MASVALAEFAGHKVARCHVPKNISQRLLAEAAGVDAAARIRDAVCQKASGLVEKQTTWYRDALKTLNLVRMTKFKGTGISQGIPNDSEHNATLRDRGAGLDAARDVLSAVSLAAEQVVKDRIKMYKATLDQLERIIAGKSNVTWQPEDQNRLGWVN